MKTFTIKISDDAAGMLEEMQTVHGVKPENVIRLCVESSMGSALNDSVFYSGCVQDAVDPDTSAAYYWKGAKETF